MPLRFTDFQPEYLCVLNTGCSGTGHSLNCQSLNAKYAERQILVESRRRVDVMRALGVEV